MKMIRPRQNKSTSACLTLSMLFVLLGLCVSLEEARGSNISKGQDCFYDGNFIKALSYFRKTIEENPNEPLAYHYTGLAYFELKKFNKAESSFKKVLELKPDFDLARLKLARCCVELENYTCVKTHLQYLKNKDSAELEKSDIAILERLTRGSQAVAKQKTKKDSEERPKTVSSLTKVKKPEIIIINPPPASRGISVVDAESITIRGRVKDAYGVKWVTINGRDADLGHGGFFKLSVLLAGGRNKFIVKAMNSKGAAAEKVFFFTKKTAVTGPPATKPSVPKIFAFLMGVNNYHDKRVADLNFAEQDARAFYDFIIHPRKGGLKKERVALLLGDSATALAIERHIKMTFRDSAPGDLVILYMATHGLPDPEGGSGLFFLASDSNLDFLLKTSISKSDLEKILSRYISNRKILLISDACHAGGVAMSSQLLAFKTRSIQQRTFRLLNKLAGAQDGLAILSASRANELSMEDPRWGGGHGVFTYYLIRGLKGEADTSPSDGFVVLRELRDYLYDRVSRATKNLQTPELVGNYDPNLPVAAVR